MNKTKTKVATQGENPFITSKPVRQPSVVIPVKSTKNKDVATVVQLAESMMSNFETTDCLYRYGDGDQIVTISDGKMKPMRKKHIECFIRYELETLSETNVSAVTDHIMHVPDSGLKRIKAFTTKPVFVGVGSAMELVTTPGFGNNIDYEPDEALRGIEFLTTADLPKAQASLNRLMEPLVDFPFVIEDDKQVFISMMLTLLLRPAIDGVIPCFFMRGNSPSLGKGLLTEIASLIVFGRRAGLVSVPKKRIQSGRPD